MSVNFPFVVIDIETTGLNYSLNEIIEIGAIRFNLDGSTEKFSHFIKPVDKVPIFIYNLTKIKEHELAEADKAKVVLKKLSDFIDTTDIIVCHNADFDIKFLNTQLIKHNIHDLRNSILDTLTLSRIFLPYLSNHKLITVAEYFNINLENAHRAIYDAEATGLILKKITEFIHTYLKPEDINFLVTITEYTQKQEKGANRFLYKDNPSYLLQYLTMLRDQMIKTALLRGSAPDNPYEFKHFNYIEHVSASASEVTLPEIDTVFREGGLFSKSFENYELRQGQIDMSKAVLDAFEKEEYLLVEAGTGVGKSLAYLIPSLIYSIKRKKKIVVSTNTKNLQEQLLFKDIPLIMKAVDISFSVVLVKGRENYLCYRKWNEIYESFLLKQSNIPFSPQEAFALLYLYLWILNTKTGDITENQSFHNSKLSYIWKKLASDRHLCQSRKCRFFNKCFLMEVRQKAEKANMLIVNHSLLFSDIRNPQPTLGEIDYLIFDEAHNLLHSTAGYLGLSLSFADINGFLNTIFSIRNDFQYGMIVNLKNSAMKSIIPDTEKTLIVKTIDELIDYMKENKTVVETPFKISGAITTDKGSYNKFRIKQVDSNLSSALSDLVSYLKQVSGKLLDLHGMIVVYEAKKFADQEIMLDFLSKTDENINQHVQNIECLINPDLKSYAYWLSTHDVQIENYPSGIFNYAPIQVDEILPEMLYSKIKSMIFTSATLGLRASFKFFMNNMGLDKNKIDKAIQNPAQINQAAGEAIATNNKLFKINEKVVPSPFNYDEQTLILNTEFLPNTSDPYFQHQSKDLIKSILEVNKVGTLILFTSKKDLEAIYEALEQTCYESDVLLLAQRGSSGRSNLLNQFITNGKAVLLGTSSFWEGVDVQGESLELLILHKLPFQPPTDPIVEALLEKLDREGKKSFMHYSLPVALLKMRQGVGRLVRSKTDRGVIVILDNRITTKEYGKYFKEIIPTQIYTTKNPTETIDAITKKLKRK